MPSWQLGISKVCYSTRIIPYTIDPTHIDALLTMVDCGEVLKSVFNYAIEQYDQGYAKMTIITDHALVVWGTVGSLSDVKFPQIQLTWLVGSRLSVYQTCFRPAGIWEYSLCLRARSVHDGLIWIRGVPLNDIYLSPTCCTSLSWSLSGISCHILKLP